MHDPVVVVETGQVYDNMSILRWFEAGNNTCPLTGVTLASQKLTRLPRLRSGIDAWAKEHNMRRDPPEKLESQREYRELDNLCRSLSFVTSKGVSVYDPVGVVELLSRQTIPERYAALVVLRERIQHSDEKQFKQISDLIDIDLLRNLLDEEGLKKPAAKLLLSLKGTLNMEDLASLLVIPDIDLQVLRAYGCVSLSCGCVD